MDEARIGQKGRATYLWYQRGVRPRGVREQRFAAAHRFAAVCPERDAGVALVLPEVSTVAMPVFLAELSCTLPAGTHAGLVPDRAGSHVSADLLAPENVTLVHLPPKSPELNPVEKVRYQRVEVLTCGLRACRGGGGMPGGGPSPCQRSPSLGTCPPRSCAA